MEDHFCPGEKKNVFSCNFEFISRKSHFFIEDINSELFTNRDVISQI